MRLVYKALTLVLNLKLVQVFRFHFQISSLNVIIIQIILLANAQIAQNMQYVGNIV